MLKTIISNQIWLPEQVVDMASVKTAYKRRIYEESKCARCPYLEDRHSSYCDPCPQYKGEITLYDQKKINGHRYVGVPIGDKKNIVRTTQCSLKWVFDKRRILDKRPTHKFKNKLRFTGTLFDYQEPAVEDWLKAGSGALTAAPRTGKTIMSVNAICRMGLRTIVLTNQDDLLTQFLKEFRANTNVLELERKTGKPIVAVAKSLEEILPLDCALVTYQTFLSPKGKEKLKALRSHFSVVLCDEMHRCAATEFSRVVKSFNARYKMGVTATFERKDQLHLVSRMIIGPVVAKSKREALKPVVYIKEINRKPRWGTCKTWTGGVSWLSKDKQRNKIVVDLAVKAINSGHSVLIPAVRVAHIRELVQEINKKAGKNIAHEFMGQTPDREVVLKRARLGKIKCIVAQRSLLTGINVPCWSALLEIIPMSNEPNHYQEVMRISTVHSGKPQPVIIHLVSGWGAERGCLHTCMKVYSRWCKVPKKTWNEYKRLSSRRHADESENENNTSISKRRLF